MSNTAAPAAAPSTDTAPGIKVRGVDFVLYWVSDMERSLRFYRDFLGLRVGANWENQWVELDTPPTTLALVRAGADGSDAPPTTGAHAPSIALAVEDVHAAIAEAKRRGITVKVEPMDSPVCVSAVILDPDGNLVGLHARNDGTFG
jgi:catechol 2,3-dioxygenase-like lactoylglutathione lyase family enzyme